MIRTGLIAISALWLAGCTGTSGVRSSTADVVTTLSETEILALSDIPETALRYSEARRRIDNVFGSGQRETLYCGCQYDEDDALDWDSCGFTPRIPSSGILSSYDESLAQKMTVEHVVPASWVGYGRECWALGGRDACEGDDPVYDIIVADLVNLRPSVGQVNRDRSNFSFAEIDADPYQYGACQFVIDFSTDEVEPAWELKGDIARITLYMAYRYDIAMDSDYLDLMESWSLFDPVSTQECDLNQRILSEQGRANPLVEKDC